MLKKVLALGDRLLGIRASTGTTRTTVCECGHDHPPHGHYRVGTQCVLCECDHYRGGYDGEGERPSLRSIS
jgi:hypothetical protein